MFESYLKEVSWHKRTNLRSFQWLAWGWIHSYAWLPVSFGTWVENGFTSSPSSSSSFQLNNWFEFMSCSRKSIPQCSLFNYNFLLNPLVKGSGSECIKLPSTPDKWNFSSKRFARKCNLINHLGNRKQHHIYDLLFLAALLSLMKSHRGCFFKVFIWIITQKPHK